MTGRASDLACAELLEIQMRKLLGVLLAFTATAAVAAPDPRTIPTKRDVLSCFPIRAA